MSERNTTTTTTQEQTQVQAAEAKRAEYARSQELLAWASQLYPVAKDGMDVGDFYAATAEAAGMFREELSYLPRCAAELDAWMNSRASYDAYLLANPLPTAAPAAEPAKPEPAAANPNEPSTVEAEIEAQAELLAQADKHLAAARKAMLKAEKGLRDGMLECGRESSDYIRCREMTGHDLDAIMDALGGQLNAYSSRHLDKALILAQVAAFQACRLLCSDVNPTHTKKLGERLGTMAWGCFEQGWALLVQSKRDQSEGSKYVVTTYSLLRGMEAECQALFDEGLKAGWTVKTVAARCHELAGKWSAAEKERVAKRLAELDTELQQLGKTAEEAKERAEAKDKERATYRDTARDSNDPAVKAEYTAKEEAAAKERAEALAVVKDCQERMDAIKREAKGLGKTLEYHSKAAEKHGKAADKAKDKAKGKAKDGKAESATVTVEGATGATQPPAAQPSAKTDNRPECNQGEPILATLARMAKQAPSKDMGQLLANTIRKAEDVRAVLYDTLVALAVGLDKDSGSELGVDDVLETVLSALQGAECLPCLSTQGKRALQAAQLVLHRKGSPSPAEVAQAAAPEKHTNGQLTVVGAA